MAPILLKRFSTDHTHMGTSIHKDFDKFMNSMIRNTYMDSITTLHTLIWFWFENKQITSKQNSWVVQ